MDPLRGFDRPPNKGLRGHGDPIDVDPLDGTVEDPTPNPYQGYPSDYDLSEHDSVSSYFNDPRSLRRS